MEKVTDFSKYTDIKDFYRKTGMTREETFTFLLTNIKEGKS